MGKIRIPKDPLLDILQGVDMVGTMLHKDIPRVLAELDRIRELVEAGRESEEGEPPARPPAPRAVDDSTQLLLEIRELLEVQDRRLSALEQRLARLVETISA